MTTSVASARSLIEEAEVASLMLVAGHTFEYNAAVWKLREVIQSGSLGMVAHRYPAVVVRAVDDLEPIAHRMGHVAGASGRALPDVRGRLPRSASRPSPASRAWWSWPS
jgi:hypothetical protein